MVFQMWFFFHSVILCWRPNTIMQVEQAPWMGSDKCVFIIYYHIWGSLLWTHNLKGQASHSRWGQTVTWLLVSESWGWGGGVWSAEPGLELRVPELLSKCLSIMELPTEHGMSAGCEAASHVNHEAGGKNIREGQCQKRGDLTAQTASSARVSGG